MSQREKKEEKMTRVTSSLHRQVRIAPSICDFWDLRILQSQLLKEDRCGDSTLPPEEDRPSWLIGCIPRMRKFAMERRHKSWNIPFVSVSASVSQQLMFLSGKLLPTHRCPPPPKIH
ncbi:hypothetical protein CDAR_185651 [Caerostris darwini]|uniref:Uncharacterized protein n=1 Tax=Caerostris darwini TaxID=1538125 RepID=A0AAV4T6Z8_9ARAC|nr:hypothetical protein CDAR_185651 [Caerostris darwini]